MRKNKSFKVCKSKEISIELENELFTLSSRPKNISQGVSAQPTSREERPPEWDTNASLSKNILKEIISYSNLPPKRTKHTSTIAIFEKKSNERINKITKKLTLDQNSRMLQSASQASICELTHSMQKADNNADRSQNHSFIQSVHSNAESFQEDTPRTKGKKEIEAVRYDELENKIESFRKEFNEVISIWEQQYECETEIESLTLSQKEQENKLFVIREELKELHESLYEENVIFLNRQENEHYRSTNCREKVLSEAEYAHQEMLRKITMREFEEIVLFNIKVTIPACSSKNTITTIYEEMFKNKSTKKFTMLLKKHSAQMDMYDNRILSEYFKKIVELETQLIKGEPINSNTLIYEFFNRINEIVKSLEIKKEKEKIIMENQNNITKKINKEETMKKYCTEEMNKFIERLNFEISKDFKQSTMTEADFKALLECKYFERYNEYAKIRREQSFILTSKIE